MRAFAPVSLQPVAPFARPIRLPSGPSGGGSGRLAPAALADLGRQIERLLDGGQDGVYGVDRNGRATLVMPSVSAMTGYAAEAMVGRHVHELLHHSHSNGDRYPREHCPIFNACCNGQIDHAHEVFWRRDGSSFPIEYTTTPLVQSGEVVGGVVVISDLSQRQRVREGLRELLDETQDGPGPGPEDQPAVGVSAAWLSVMQMARRVADVDTTVLLLGESGTGKEVVARAIHHGGSRRKRPLVTLNCAGIPEGLVESELFGHERGAFTGATSQRIGRFEQAQDGTLFLDEVGELPLVAQAKLLRVLQQREFERVGGTRSIRSAARVIAATNCDLRALVAAGRFRLDLYYRLEVFPIRLPPLRERREDIPLLVRHFLGKLERRLGRRLSGFSSDSERGLRAHHWPGNVRELENVVERAALLSETAVLELPALEPPCPPLALGAVPGRQGTALDREAILAALARTDWKVTGACGAANALGVHPNTLRKHMRRLTIRRPAE